MGRNFWKALAFAAVAGAHPSPHVRAQSTEDPQQNAGKVRIAVMEPENLAQDPAVDDLRQAIAEPLCLGLEGKKWLTVVERSQLANVLEEQKLGLSGAIESQTAAQIGRLLGANWFLMGSYFAWNNEIRMMMKFVNVETGQIDASKFVSADGELKDTLGLIERLVEQTGRALSAKKADLKEEEAKPLRIAILPFINIRKIKEYDPVGPATAELLQNALPTDPAISVVERAQMQKLIKEMKLGPGGAVDPKTAAEIGHLHGANVLLLGSFTALGKEIQITARFVETETGRVGSIRSVTVRGKASDLFRLQDRLADAIKRNVKERH